MQWPSEFNYGIVCRCEGGKTEAGSGESVTGDKRQERESEDICWLKEDMTGTENRVALKA